MAENEEETADQSYANRELAVWYCFYTFSAALKSERVCLLRAKEFCCENKRQTGEHMQRERHAKSAFSMLRPKAQSVQQNSGFTHVDSVHH